MARLLPSWLKVRCGAEGAGITGYSLGKRDVYVTDEIFAAVWDEATSELRNAMDLANLTGQRPSDALRMSEDHIVNGYLVVNQGKTAKKPGIVVSGELADLLAHDSQRTTSRHYRRRGKIVRPTR